MEAMAKLKEGQKFNEVASAFSEDKARQGVSYLSIVRYIIIAVLLIILYTSPGRPRVDEQGLYGGTISRRSLPAGPQHHHLP